MTLTGRDRPGVTSRLFSALAPHELSVVDVEQVVIRGRLILGVLLDCGPAPDLTAIHRQVTTLAADLGMEAEITVGAGEQPPRRRGSLHVTVLGSPLTPAVVASIAGQIAASGANIDRIGRLAQPAGHLHRVRRVRGRPGHAAGGAGPGVRPSSAPTSPCSGAGCTGGPCAWW